MRNTNTIHGLFHIPDESSFLKKLILTHPTVYNPDVIEAFKRVQQNFPDLEMVQKEHYFSLLLPTESEGLQLEAMIITTEEEKQKYLSIYHRLHFDTDAFPEEIQLVESDAFLRLSAVIVNVPYTPGKIDALASVLNFQVHEAIHTEITMLSLADSNTEVVEQNVSPFIENAIGRYTLACVLDDVPCEIPKNAEVLSQRIAEYCDLPLMSVARGISHCEHHEEECHYAHDIFIPEFASSSICMMLLLLEQKTAEALLQDGGFAMVKEFFTEQYTLFGLTPLQGFGEHLGSYNSLNP